MRARGALELAFRLFEVPGRDVHVADVGVQRLRDHRTSRDRSVGSVGIFVFTMPFEQDACIHSIYLCYVGALHILC